MIGALGFDTSNYTTSVAYYDGVAPCQQAKLLQVPEGALGLRQSDAHFQHVKALPLLMEMLCQQMAGRTVVAVGASTQPRAVEGSYMPCFLPGEGHGRVTAAVLGVPFYPCSHQQGHLAAAAWSAGQITLLERPFLAWHLSGGTTELLYVVPSGVWPAATAIGGSQDISAGQLIDRTGQRLGFAFPAGRALDELGAEGAACKPFPLRINGLTFSLSGMENKVNDMLALGDEPAKIARFVLETVAHGVHQVTQKALAEHPGLPVLFSGGVAANRLLRQRLPYGLFAQPVYSTDNAMGVGILAQRRWEAEHG